MSSFTQLETALLQRTTTYATRHGSFNSKSSTKTEDQTKQKRIESLFNNKSPKEIKKGLLSRPTSPQVPGTTLTRASSSGNISSQISTKAKESLLNPSQFLEYLKKYSKEIQIKDDFMINMYNFVGEIIDRMQLDESIKNDQWLIKNSDSDAKKIEAQEQINHKLAKLNASYPYPFYLSLSDTGGIGKTTKNDSLNQHRLAKEFIKKIGEYQEQRVFDFITESGESFSSSLLLQLFLKTPQGDFYYHKLSNSEKVHVDRLNDIFFKINQPDLEATKSIVEILTKSTRLTKVFKKLGEDQSRFIEKFDYSTKKIKHEEQLKSLTKEEDIAKENTAWEQTLDQLLSPILLNTFMLDLSGKQAYAQRLISKPAELIFLSNQNCAEISLQKIHLALSIINLKDDLDGIHSRMFGQNKALVLSYLTTITIKMTDYLVKHKKLTANEALSFVDAMKTAITAIPGKKLIEWKKTEKIIKYLNKLIREHSHQSTVASLSSKISSST